MGLLYSAAFGVASGLVYAFVGRNVVRRTVSERFLSANRLFAIWWYMLGATAFVGAIQNVVFYAGFQDLNAYVAVSMLAIFVICLALWGLLYYLIFLFTGRQGWLAPLGVFYALYFFLLVYFILAHKPMGLEEKNWSVMLTYGVPVEQDLLYQAVILLLLGPQLLGALGLFSLVFRAEGREQKFRLATVSLSILVWFGSALAASVAGFGEETGYQIASRFIGLGAALAILAAYRPPVWVKKWIAQEPPAPEGEASPPAKDRLVSGSSGRPARSDPVGTAL